MLIKQKETKAKYDQLRKCQSGERIKKENIWVYIHGESSWCIFLQSKDYKFHFIDSRLEKGRKSLNTENMTKKRDRGS